VTAYGDDERRQRAAEYGAADFLAKPVDFEHLKAQLRQFARRPEFEENLYLDRMAAYPLPFDRYSGPGEGRLRGMKSGSRRQG
jgi:DNA-binding response OmpR family regulator